MFVTKIIPIIFYALLIIFLVVYLRSIDYSVFNDVKPNWWFLSLSLIFGLAFRYWSAYIWIVLLRSLGADNIRYSSSLIQVYAKSWLGRYIPGTAPWILGKIYFASKHGISKNKLAVSSLLEGALQIVVLLSVSFALLISDSRLDVISSELKLLMFFALLGCIISLYPRIFNLFVSQAYRLIKRKTLNSEHLPNPSTIFRGAALYLIGAVFNGISLFFVAKAVYPELPYDQFFFIMGVGTLAGAASMLAVFAPSGIGVREAIQLVLLSLVMPTELALIVTVATRVIGIACDFAFVGLASLARSYKT